MSKLNPRGLVRETSIKIKSLLILDSKMHQRKALLVGFLLSLLLFSVLGSVTQFQLFRVDAIIEKSNRKAFTVSGIYNQSKLNSHSLVNLSSHIIPKRSVLTDSLNKSLSGGQPPSLAFKGSDIEKMPMLTQLLPVTLRMLPTKIQHPLLMLTQLLPVTLRMLPTKL